MMKVEKKVLVAMSGGVDSSVSAYLLKKSGYNVAGLTMCFGIKKTSEKRLTCCGERATEDAKAVCRKLKIPHYVMDFSRYLKKNVIDKFISEYINGKTPNPCVDCNRNLKFNILLKKALSMGFDFLATGHYAGIEKKDGRYILKKAKDKSKDQSYFLYCIKKSALKNILFPLGSLTKNEVRRIARGVGLPVADKPQSQDICFIPDRNYHGFLAQSAPGIISGPIVTLEGELIGEHKGAAFYTIGQRRGLGVGHEHPLYVLSKDAVKNRLIVGDRKDLSLRGLLADDVNIIVDKLPKSAFAKIRYNQKEAKCRVFPRHNGKKLEILFKEPQEAVTPGQSVVLYESDTVLGGGVIERAFGGI